MKKWRCTVCNYVHTGDEPPERCPQCGADRSKFVPVEAEAEGDQAPPAGGPAEAPSDASPFVRLLAALSQRMRKSRTHPIMVHLPNGVLPAAVILLFLGLLFSHEGLKQAAFYNMVLVVFSMPVVFLSGYVDWKEHMGGVYTGPIVTKIVSGAVVFVLGIVLVLWGWFGTASWPFFLLHLLALAAAGVAGHIGGKLVFGSDDGAAAPGKPNSR